MLYLMFNFWGPTPRLEGLRPASHPVIFKLADLVEPHKFIKNLKGSLKNIVQIFGQI